MNIPVENRSNSYDVIVIGGGPAGSTTAAYLARKNYRVLLLEKDTFPRYHVGESLTGMASEIIEDFGLEKEMEKHNFPVKGGVKILGKGAKSEFFVSVLRSTWQVRRDEFDTILLNNALSYGVIQHKAVVKNVLKEDSRVVGVSYQIDKETIKKEAYAKYLVDASGSSVFLSKKGVAGEQKFVKEFERQVAVFSQFKNVKRDPGQMRDNTFLFYSNVNEWAWFIPLSDQTVSIGVVMPNKRVKELGGPEKTMKWGLQNINPNLAERMVSAEQIEPIRAIRKYAYIIEPFVGDGWLCVGDAHRFSDPIFSFGVSFALVEARAAAEAIDKAMQSNNEAKAFEDYVIFCDKGQNAAFDVIRYFWHFPVFFGFQAKGKFRKEIIRLLSSDCHNSDDIEILQMMRNALKEKEEQKQESPLV